VIPGSRTIPDDIAALRAALVAEQLARREAEACASGAEAMVAHLKLLIAKLRHEQFGTSSERGRKLLDQLVRLPRFRVRFGDLGATCPLLLFACWLRRPWASGIPGPSAA
jgi:hypothetical protein